MLFFVQLLTRKNANDDRVDFPIDILISYHKHCLDTQLRGRSGSRYGIPP